MLSRLLCYYAHPSHVRDFETLKNVSKRVKVALILCVVAGVGMFTLSISWLILLVVAAFIASLGSIVFNTLMLKKEFSLRRSYRQKRLALPEILADGVAAGERHDLTKLVSILTHRLMKHEDFTPQSLIIFDCLIHDLFRTTPDLAKDLLAVGRNLIKA